MGLWLQREEVFSVGTMGLSHYALARDINMPRRRINEIVHDDRSIDADTALRLSHYVESTLAPVMTGAKKVQAREL